jgi:hypothetical protein
LLHSACPRRPSNFTQIFGSPRIREATTCLLEATPAEETRRARRPRASTRSARPSSWPTRIRRLRTPRSRRRWSRLVTHPWLRACGGAG